MENKDQDLIDINDFFLIQSPEVQNNAKVVSFKDSGPMLHIDKNVPKVFIPRMPSSAADSENDTCARVTVSPTLVGCLIGYQRAENDFLSGLAADTKRRDSFKGGYVISELPYTYCINPNNKLVFDATRSLEHWLVSYSKNTLTYKPIEHGKMFISSIISSAQTGKRPATLITVYIQHSKKEGIHFTSNKLLEPGFYKAELLFKDYSDRTESNESAYSVEKCSEEEYTNAKNQCAALLSQTDKTAPSFFKW